VTQADRGGYRGRFAPSPTGPLHLGSLIAALASFLDARKHDGRWLVRMEDLDPPREQFGAAEKILASLSAHGLRSDEPVLWQSRRGDRYRAALAQLAADGLLFPCVCSRRLLGPRGACEGRCRGRQMSLQQPSATRIAVPPDTLIEFTDLLQGPQQWPLGRDCPDFTLLRKDGLFAYQLAVVVDDGEQGVTHVVRGSDLLDSTPRQIFLQHQLRLPTPAYLHIPVITNELGQKFSKQNHAPALADHCAAANLRMALRFLCQQEPPEPAITVEQILAFARQHWSRERLPPVPACAACELRD
jgi:glutamyl-Q tRNA(Asp) synthetase